MFTFAIKRKESMKKEDVKYDCSHFEGHIPCKPNKQFDVQCDDCSHYDASQSAVIFLDTKKILGKWVYDVDFVKINEKEYDKTKKYIDIIQTFLFIIRNKICSTTYRTN